MGVLMRSALYSGALTLALLGMIGLAASHYRTGTPELDTVGIGQNASLDDEFEIETTGSIGATSPARLRLDDEQRGFVFLGVINVPDIADADIAPPRLAERLSEAVLLHDIPAMVIRRIPQMRGYKFVKLEDRILIVAKSREVVAAIPRFKLLVR
jgi:hypothetical protein